MKYSFSFFCCFELKFFLTFWSEFITFQRDNCFVQCVAIVGSQPIFFLLLSKSCLHPLRYHDKSLSHCVNGHVSRFFNHYNSISTQFSQWQMWKHLFRWLYCRRLFDLLVDTWSLVYRMIDKGFTRLMFLIIVLPWLRIWIYSTIKPLGMKVIGLIYENYNVFAHIVLSLLWFSFNYHMKTLHCVALRFWNINTCGIHQI